MPFRHLVSGQVLVDHAELLGEIIHKQMFLVGPSIGLGSGLRIREGKSLKSLKESLSVLGNVQNTSLNPTIIKN